MVVSMTALNWQSQGAWLNTAFIEAVTYFWWVHQALEVNAICKNIQGVGKRTLLPRRLSYWEVACRSESTGLIYQACLWVSSRKTHTMQKRPKHRFHISIGQIQSSQVPLVSQKSQVSIVAVTCKRCFSSTGVARACACGMLSGNTDVVRRHFMKLPPLLP